MTGTITNKMKALVYSGHDTVAIKDEPMPTLLEQTDAIVKVNKTTICGTDSHILAGDVPSCEVGRILGHEGTGTVYETGSSVSKFKRGDRVLISCISSCGTCEYCSKGMNSHCTCGGWMLGNSINGTQAEYVRIPHADSSLHAIPSGADEEAMVMLSDTFPTGLECGVLNAGICPGATVAIVGSGPVGLAALTTAQLYSPTVIIVIDRDPGRLEVARRLGATHTIDERTEDVVAQTRAWTEDRGCDAVIEAVGVPATFELCQKLLAPGGTLANIGVHGAPAKLYLDQLWSMNISKSWTQQLQACTRRNYGILLIVHRFVCSSRPEDSAGGYNINSNADAAHPSTQAGAHQAHLTP